MSDEVEKFLETKKIWELEKLRRLEDFDQLLDSIQAISAKEKVLWKQIYDDIISDRNRADFLYIKFIMDFSQLSNDDRRAQYNLSAKWINDLLSRMAKCTDQLTKLAEMVQNARHKEQEEDNAELIKELDKLREGTND